MADPISIALITIGGTFATTILASYLQRKWNGNRNGNDHIININFVLDSEKDLYKSTKNINKYFKKISKKKFSKHFINSKNINLENNIYRESIAQILMDRIFEEMKANETQDKFSLLKMILLENNLSITQTDNKNSAVIIDKIDKIDRKNSSFIIEEIDNNNREHSLSYSGGSFSIDSRGEIILI